MWPGWVALGPGDPFVGDDYVELVNNQRAYSYARNAGITWLLECLDCPEAAQVMPGGPDFLSPELDPAPWYDADNPDTWGFYGVVGLEVIGSDTSTRQVTITSTLQAGGVAGPPYFGPRTIVFRGLLVAQDECSLQAGMDWLRSTTVVSEDPCHGDALTFFDCCPCVCDDDSPIGPCWAQNYAELRAGPVCARVIPAPPAYWNGTVGSFIGPTSNNPGALPGFCTFVFHVRGPGTGQGPIAAQWEAGVNLRSWQIERDGAPTEMRLLTSSAGTAVSQNQSVADNANMDTDQFLALTRQVVGGQQQLTSWVGNPNGSWAEMATSTLVPNATPLDISETRPLRIGHTMSTGSGIPDTWFAGRIYSVELRTGADPSDGAVTNAIILPGGAANSLSVADHPALDVPGDLEVVLRLGFMGDFVISKWGDPSNRSWRIFCTEGPPPGGMLFAYSLDGTVTPFGPGATVDVDPLEDAPSWYRVTRSSIDGVVSFYRSTLTSTSEPTGAGWELLSSSTGTPGPLFNSNAPIALNGMGRVYRAIVRNTFGDFKMVAFTGVAGLRLTAPVAPALDLVGDLDVAIHVNIGTTETLNQHTFICKSAAVGNRSWEFGYANSRWNFRCATAAAPSTMITVQPNVAQSTATMWVRVTRVAATGVITLYTAPTSTTEPTTWTPITGTPSTQAAGPLLNSTAPLEMGGRNSATADVAQGRLIEAIVRNGIGGTVVFRFRDTDPPNAAVDTFSSFSGHTMTVGRNGNATPLYGTVLDIDEQLVPDDEVATFPAATGQTITVTGSPLTTVPSEVLWRFDAVDAYALTGTVGGTYMDPRGRNWTVQAGSITSPTLPDRGAVWWPLNYGEMTSGPPADDEDWCAWIKRYFDLTNGPPGWACCVDECVVPYLRQFYNTRITEGPVVLRQPVMHSCGAMMEIEVTLVAADPRKYTMPSATLRTIVDPGEPLAEIEAFAVETSDPFAIPGLTTSRHAGVATRTLEAPTMSSSWVRTRTTSVLPARGNILRTAVPIITVSAIDGDVGEVRLGLWRGGTRIDGYWLPFVPGGTTITIDGGLRRVLGNNGHERILSGFARDYDGGRVTWPELGHGVFELTVDQEPDRAGRLVIEVHAVDVGLS